MSFNPLRLSDCKESQLYIYTRLFENGDALKEVKKVPDRKDKAFETWQESYENWLEVFIRNTQNGLTPITDIRNDRDKMEKLRADIPPKEVQHLEVAIKNLNNDIAKLEELRDGIQDNNSKFNESYIKASKEALKLTSTQPTFAHSDTMVKIIDTQDKGEIQLRKSIERIRELENKVRANIKEVYEAVKRCATPQKVQEIELQAAENSRSLDR